MVLIAAIFYCLFKCFTKFGLQITGSSYLSMCSCHISFFYYLFFIAGVTNYNKLSCLIQHKFIILQFYEYRSELQRKSHLVKTKVFAGLPSPLRHKSEIHCLAIYNLSRLLESTLSKTIFTSDQSLLQSHFPLFSSCLLYFYRLL